VDSWKAGRREGGKTGRREGGEREAGSGKREERSGKREAGSAGALQLLATYFKFDSALNSAENGWIASRARIPAENGPRSWAMLLA
jgi:hypothetical protein